MPTCSVVGCGVRKDGKQKMFSLHRLPRNEGKRKQWLEAIGTENIKLHWKDTYICSKHFDESAFNTTMDVIRLRDEAIPLQTNKQTASQHDSYLLTENERDPTASAHRNVTNLAPVESKKANIATRSGSGSSGVPRVMAPVKSKLANIATQSVSDSSGVPSLMLPVQSGITIISIEPKNPLALKSGISNVPSLRTLNQGEMTRVLFSKRKSLPFSAGDEAKTTATHTRLYRQTLEKYVGARKKVKALHEKIRRQSKTILKLKNVIKNLQMKNVVYNYSSSIPDVLSQNSLKQQIRKSEHLHLNRQYSDVPEDESVLHDDLIPQYSEVPEDESVLHDDLIPQYSEVPEDESVLHDDLNQQYTEISEDESVLYDEYKDCLNGTLSKYAQSVAFYLAGFVAKRVSRRIKCKTCIAILLGDPKDNSNKIIQFKSKCGHKYPSKDLEHIIQKTEKIVKTNLKKDQPQNYYMYILNFMVDYCCESTSNIFRSISHNHDANHKRLLIKNVIQTYLDIRYRYYRKNDRK